MSKVKERENPKSSKRKAESYLHGSSHKKLRQVLKRNFAGEKELARRIQRDEKQGPTT